VWSTILTVLNWFTFFDLGLGNGLRNKIAECLARQEPDIAKEYISSAYSIISLIAGLVVLIVSVLCAVLNWQSIFNTLAATNSVLQITMFILGITIAINFVLSLISSVLNGVQKTSNVVFGQFITNAIFLVVAASLNVAASINIIRFRSLPFLAIGYSVALLFTSLALNIWFYRYWLKMTGMNLWPRISFNLSNIRPLLCLGLRFFLIQIAVLVLFTTDKILVTQFFGPSYVTQYDVVFKYFSIITMLYGLISVPLWPAYADAHHRQDKVWIKRMLRKQIYIYIWIIAVSIILAIFAKPVIGLWVRDKVYISGQLVVAMMIFVLISTLNDIFGSVLGGMNKIRLGSIYTILIVVVNIPLCYLFAVVWSFGISGIIIGNIVCMMASCIIGPIQVYYFLYSKKEDSFWTMVLQ